MIPSRTKSSPTLCWRVVMIATRGFMVLTRRRLRDRNPPDFPRRAPPPRRQTLLLKLGGVRTIEFGVGQNEGRVDQGGLEFESPKACGRPIRRVRAFVSKADIFDKVPAGNDT